MRLRIAAYPPVHASERLAEVERMTTKFPLKCDAVIREV